MTDDERDYEPTAEQLRDPTLERMRDIQYHVAHLIELVEGTDPRDHEAAGAEGKSWAYTLSVAIFQGMDRLETSLFPHFPATVNSGRRINTFWWPAYVQAAIDRLLDVTDVLIRRWRAPKFCEKLWTAKGDTPDWGTRNAIIERGELEELRKVNKELIRGLAKVEGERPAERGDESATSEADTKEEEARRDNNLIPYAGGVYKRAPVVARAELRTIKKAVDEFVELLARIDRPGFSAAVAKSERWAFGLALSHWYRARDVDVALFPRTEAHTVDRESDPHDERRRIGFNGLPWGWGLDEALLRLEAVMEGVITRWGITETYDDELRYHQGVIYETGETIPPVLEDEEITALRWISGEIARALATAERTAEPAGEVDEVKSPWEPEPFQCTKAEALLALGFKTGRYVKKLDQLKTKGQLYWEKAPPDSIKKGSIIVWLSTPEKHADFVTRVMELRRQD